MTKLTKKSKYISPLSLFFLNLLPSLLLLILILVGLISVTGSSGQRDVLGEQAVLPQIKTETVEHRIQELMNAKGQMNSEAVNKELEKLR